MHTVFGDVSPVSHAENYFQLPRQMDSRANILIHKSMVHFKKAPSIFDKDRVRELYMKRKPPTCDHFQNSWKFTSYNFIPTGAFFFFSLAPVEKEDAKIVSTEKRKAHKKDT